MYGFPMFSERNMCRRIDVCDSFLKRHENNPFLKRIITGDEKDEPAQTISKADILQKKIRTNQHERCSVSPRQRETSHKFGHLPKASQLELDTMPHPPYSPDLAPSDYYLFRSFQKFLDGKTFTSNEEVKNDLDQFFASKGQTFYERGIMLLPERWQKVLDQNDQYKI
ncbi:mariner Mos1 transposase [Trichonephila clavipes]|nr:mariner Mos1 transposase [Trichonephila clavipes]